MDKWRAFLVAALAAAVAVADGLGDLTLDEPDEAGGPGAVPAAEGESPVAHGVALRFYRNLFSFSLNELAEFARRDARADISRTLPDFTLRDPWWLSRTKGITRCYGAILDAWVTARDEGDYRFILPTGGGGSYLEVATTNAPESFRRVNFVSEVVSGMPEYRIGRDRKATAEKARVTAEKFRLKAGERIRLRALFTSGWEDRFFVGWTKSAVKKYGDEDDNSLQLKDWAVEKPVFDTKFFEAIPAKCLTPVPSAGAAPRLTVGNPSLPMAVHPADDEPDSLCWDRFADERVFVEHFLDWAATNPPPEAVDVPTGGGQSPRPFVWVKTAEVDLKTNNGIWCNTNFVKGAGCVALRGPGSHDIVSTCHFDVEVPVEGDYRLWCRYRRWGPRSSDTFNLRVVPVPSATPDRDGIGAVLTRFEQCFARSNPHPGRLNDPTPQIMSVPYPPDGWTWEGTHRTAHLEPGRYRFSFWTGQYPAQGGPVISDLVLTADPMLDPATVEPRKTSCTGTLPASEAICNPLYAIRPGADIDTAPPERLAWWRKWRDALFDKLCDAEYSDYVWGYLATLNYFDEDSNLIGRVREVRSQKSADAPTGIVAVTGDDFARTNGWDESAHPFKDYGQARNIFRRSGATNLMTFAEIELPHAGRYRLMVCYCGWNGACVAAVEAGGERRFDLLVGLKEGRNWAVSEPAELPAGKARVTLTTCHNPKHGGQPPPASAVAVTRVLLVERPDFLPALEIHYPDGRRVGDGDLAFWCQDPFNAFTRYSPPAEFPTNLFGSYYMATDYTPTDGWSPLPAEEIGRTEHAVEAVSGEVKSQLVLIRNNTGKPVVIRPVVEGKLPSSVRLVAYTVTCWGMWSPQILLRREEVACPPLQNTALWISIDCRGAKEGDYPVTLRFADKAVTWNVAVRGTFDGVPEPYLYPYARPYPRRSCWELYKDYGLNTVSYVPLPRKAMEDYGIKLLIGIPREIGVNFEDSVRKTIAKAEALGQRPGDYTWYLIDEPGADDVPYWMKMAKTVKAVDPGQYIWCNLGDGGVSQDHWDLFSQMMDYWDVSCPFITQFNHDEKCRPYYEKLKKAGKIRLTYHTLDIGANEKRLEAPQDLINLAAFATREGLDGYANFSLMNGPPYDDLYMDNQDLAVSIYPGSRGRTLATRNLEAFREGGQRWRRAKMGK